jgi:hypothetical protein
VAEKGRERKMIKKKEMKKVKIEMASLESEKRERDR